MTNSREATVAPRSQPKKSEPLPTFSLPDIAGMPRRLWDHKQRHPVVLFVPHAPDCEGCRAWLSSLNGSHGRLDELGAAVLVIVRATSDAARALQSGLDLPFTVLADTGGVVAARYVAPGTAGLFLGDRYLQCLGAWRDDSGHVLPAPDEVIGIVAFSEQEDCGCGLPAWPEDVM